MHTQFSWDAPRGDMEATCRRAIELGLPAIAFTDHADFTGGGYDDHDLLDVAAYRAELDRCRSLFPDLRIVRGVELAQAHRFPAEAAAVLEAGAFDRVLGSVHCVDWQGALRDVSLPGPLDAACAPATFRVYLADLLELLRSEQPMDVLAHLDYPRRYWPHDELPYRAEDHEEEIRAVLRAAAQREAALELNTTRGAEPARGLCAAPPILGWWVEEGGRTLTMGSDAHRPDGVARGFELAAELADAAGFRPNDDPTGFWRR